MLQKIQTTNYIKIRNINLHVPVSKAEKERNKFACELYQKYTGWMDGWMDGYFVYRRSTLKGHIASNKFYVI